MISDWTKRLLRLRLWLYRRLTLDEAQSTLLLAALVGALGGLSSPLFHEALQLVTKLFTGTEGPLVAVARSLEPWQRAAVPILGSLVAGWVTGGSAGDLAGGGKWGGKGWLAEGGSVQA